MESQCGIDILIITGQQAENQADQHKITHADHAKQKALFKIAVLERCDALRLLAKIDESERITCRPADLLEPELGKLEEEVGEYKEQDEDILTYALFGPVALDLEKPCRERGFTLADMRFAKPLDYAFLDRVGRSCSLLMTVEDGARSGGLGEEIAAYFEEQGYSCRVEIAAVPDRFIMEDTREAILKELRLDAAGVIARIDECLKGALPSARAEGGSLAKPRILHQNRSK